jgi:pimeloyl-ACP methyl ester carboxylesterase
MDCRAQAAALSIPVLSLHGANDQILPAAMREQTLYGVPHIRHLQHPTAGHLLPVEYPDWCAAQIATFLDETC